MNQFLLPFSHRLIYDDGQDIVVPIYLSSDSDTIISVDAKLDTGSTFCVFQSFYATMLGFELERGLPQPMRSVTGSFMTYGHEVTIAIEDIEWQAMIYFAVDEFFPVSVLGRTGFLDRLKIALIDYDQELYLNAYDI